MSPPEHSPDGEDLAEVEIPPPRIRCATCGVELCDEDDVFSMTSSGAVHVFPNPSGQLLRIVTVRRAEPLIPVSVPTTDFTWFAGYAWTIVVCGDCETHLGWRYDGAAEPKRFFGLLVSAIERG